MDSIYNGSVTKLFEEKARSEVKLVFRKYSEVCQESIRPDKIRLSEENHNKGLQVLHVGQMYCSKVADV